MNAPIIAAQPSPQPQQDHHRKGEASLYDSFVSRVAAVDRLIDEKTGYIMENARLRSLIKSGPKDSEHRLALIQDLEDKINLLQEQIDRELKGLFYGLQKAPAPSPFLDDLPG
ncbi:MAG: hypothetical protein EOP06_25970 [Proteobacteria bacterium]|nr:MAG: hypothetical protein EOP06_25970 [Pseudomonadota bacterium]